MIHIDTKKCTACGACLQVCPVSCITMSESVNGFCYPSVDAAACISCGKCDAVCPMGTTPSLPAGQLAIAAVHKNEDTLLQSTSGGVFLGLAEYVLGKDGVVYGCAYKNLKPVHTRVTDRQSLLPLCGSKYVQSDTGSTFRQAQEDLDANRLVLYTGTPCQIAGLKAFLQKPYENLITADLICHGVPSYAYFKKSLSALEKNYKLQLTDVDFRSKQNRGWSCAGTVSGRDPAGVSVSRKFNPFQSYHYHYFLKGDIYRSCCYTCQYASRNRVADFTLGDFWGVEGLCLNFSVEKGCSLVLLNSKKATSLLPQLPLNTQEVSIEEAIRCNSQLNAPSALTPRREELLRQYRECSAEEIDKIFRQTCRRAILIGRLKRAMPAPVKNFLLKLRYKRLFSGTK